MKRIIVAMFILLFLTLPIVVSAEETDRERLVRIETKIDIVLDQQKILTQQDEDADVRISDLERKVFVLWLLVGGLTTISAGVMVKIINDALKKRG